MNIPQLSCLLAVTSVERDTFTSSEKSECPKKYHTAVIRQDDHEIAREVCPQLGSLLTSQFCQLNKKMGLLGRQPIPGQDKTTSEADFIVSPLPFHTKVSMEQSVLGGLVDAYSKISKITLIAACTTHANELVNNHIKNYVVFGYGIGRIGQGCSENHFGTAGIMRQAKELEVEM
jgi:hypothetical protein